MNTITIIFNNIDFIPQKKFEKCINPKTNRQLRFDFFIPHKKLLIEADGLQHFKPIKFFGGENHFKKRKYLDGLKTEFTVKNNIKLLRIPHTELHRINEILKTHIM